MAGRYGGKKITTRGLTILNPVQLDQARRQGVSIPASGWPVATAVKKSPLAG